MYTKLVTAFLTLLNATVLAIFQNSFANNDNYCPDIFKHSRVLAEGMMETLKKI